MTRINQKYIFNPNWTTRIGWAPVTGLPLPLISYGGTALIVNGVEIGLLQNVALRRSEF